jgi:1,4-alpha-glucan branching enzyme
MNRRRPVGGALGCVALVAGLATGCAAAVPRGAVSTQAGVRFSLRHESARQVAVAGSFNQWSATSHPLARSGRGGDWVLLLPLPAGSHAFMFVVDGMTWLSPPFADEYVDDGFGVRNGVVVVPPR